MTDIYSPQKRSRIMSSVKSKNTLLEKRVFAYLRSKGIPFQKHVKSLPGSPDIVSRSKRKVVFVDGDFWHGWRFNQWKDKLPSDFWRAKITENIKRDKLNVRKLRSYGWIVIRIWGHNLRGKQARERTLERIEAFLSRY